MLAIYKKEIRSYFTSMIGYVFMAFFLAMVGLFFYLQNLLGQNPRFEDTLTGVTFIFVLLTPIITMRLMAEENKQKTDQLLYTSPLTAGSIVIGKFLAVFTVYLMIMAIVCLYPIILLQFGDIALAPAYSSLLGFSLLGGAYLALGLFISSLTESQVVAAVISFLVFLFTLFMDDIAGFVPADNRTSVIAVTIILLMICIILYLMMHNLMVSISVGIILEAVILIVYFMKPILFDGLVSKVVGWLSVLNRYNSFYLGILDLSAIVYYLSIIFIFLYFTVQVIRKKRWS